MMYHGTKKLPKQRTTLFASVFSATPEKVQTWGETERGGTSTQPKTLQRKCNTAAHGLEMGTDTVMLH